MRHRTFLPLLALALACGGDASILGRDAAQSPEGPVVATAASNPAQGGWSFTAVASFTQNISPGVTRITPGSVLHTTDLVNEFLLTGDVEGLFYFDGTFHNVLRTGKGPIVGTVFFDLTVPQVGTFECQSQAILEGFVGPVVSATGKFFSCVGSGSHADDKLKGTLSLRPDASTWDIEGTIF